MADGSARVVLLGLLACSPSTDRSPASLALRLPIACAVGDDCWISNRPDVDPGPEIRDHAGSSDTYKGHEGTDESFRTHRRSRTHHAAAARATGECTIATPPSP